MKYIAVISDGKRFTNFVKASQGRAETSATTFINIREIEDCRGFRFNDVICLIDNPIVEDEVNSRLTREEV